LLSSARPGDAKAAEEILPLVYSELRREIGFIGERVEG